MTSFSCRYRQKAGFAGPWELATRARRGEPASPVTRIQSYTPTNETADGTINGVRKEREDRKYTSVALMFILLIVVLRTHTKI